MINASKEFKEKLKRERIPLVNYADITLSDGTVLNLTYKDFMIGGCTIEDKTTDGKFGVGFVIGKTLTVRLANHDEKFSEYDFYLATINLYVGMLLDDGTIEKIRKGIYYVTVPSTTGEIIEISAVDAMYRLDKDYSDSTTTYPATLQTILTDCCTDCGIPIGFTQFDNMGFIVQEKPEGVTYRQIVSYVAQIAGYNARIDNDGYIQLVWYKTNLLEQYNYVGGDFKKYKLDNILDGGDFKDYSAQNVITGPLFSDETPEHIFRIKTLDVHTDDIQITGVKVAGEDKNTVLSGEDGYVIEIKDNPFVYGKEQQVADYLGQRMIGIVFRPFSAEILNNPLYEPFDIVMLSDSKGNVYFSVINSLSYTIGAYTQIACEAEDPAANGSTYPSPAAQAVVEARRNTTKQLTTYDKAVQNMTQLASNALGYHTTNEEQSDGSRITYLHDKPTLEESTVIYKQTIDGFFISTDGGRSYTAGFDKNGNAVVNILYAIGIVCDWIKGGTLTLGGFDNKNGTLSIRDKSNEEIGRWDKDGIYVNRGEIYSKTDISEASIHGGNIHVSHSGIDVGHIGTRAFDKYPDSKGIMFGIEETAYYLTWAAKSNASDAYYPVKLLYANKTFSNYTEGNLYVSCNTDFCNYEIQNAYINGLKVRNSFDIPNEVNCNIHSPVNFHSFEILNAKIDNLVAVDGITPYDGKIFFITKIENTSGGGISWIRSSATIKSGIIVGVSESAQS